MVNYNYPNGFEATPTGYVYQGKQLTRISAPSKIIGSDSLMDWAVRTDMYHLQGLLKDGKHYLESIPIASQEHVRVFEQAGRDGTKMHEDLEIYVRWCISQHGGEAISPFKMSETTNPHSPVYKFYKYASHMGWIFIDCEVVVVDVKESVAGRFDLLYCTPTGSFGIADYKSYKGFYNKAVLMQMGAYAHCLKGISSFRIHEVTALSIRSDRATILSLQSENTAMWWKMWKHARELYEVGITSKPKVEEFQV